MLILETHQPDSPFLETETSQLGGSYLNLPDPPSKEELLLFSREMPVAAEGGMGAVFDVDEVAVAIQNVAEKLPEAASNGLGALKEQMVTEAGVLHSNPTKWMANQVIPANGADAAISLAMSGFVLPLAGLAIAAGGEGTREALDNHAKLSVKSERIEKRLQLLRISSEEALPVRSYAENIEEQSLAAVNSGLKHNFYEGGIGVSTLGAGVSIFLNATLGGAITAASVAATKITAGLTMAATVVGTLTTVFIAPLTAVFTIGLGAFFLHRSKVTREELEVDRHLIDTVKKADSRSKAKAVKVKPCSVDEKYEAFIDRKFTSRHNFAERFERWNGGFLAGATCIALSAIPKGVLGIAAMAAGAGAVPLLATPPGLAVLLAVLLALGVAGGIMMGVCCWQFLVLNDKAKQHQAYRLQESHLLGRRFDALQTVYATVSPDKGGPRGASTARASLYNFVSQRDKIRQEFLHEHAMEMNKFRQWEERATDKPTFNNLLVVKERPWYKNLGACCYFAYTYLENRFNGDTHKVAVNDAQFVYELRADDVRIVSKERQWYKNTGARWSFVCTYLDNLFNGETHEASVYKARTAYALEADDLTPVGLARWLEGDSAFGASEVVEREQSQHALLGGILREQKKLLKEKLAAYDKFSPLFFEKEGLADEVKQIFKEAMEEAEMDKRCLQTIQSLLVNVKQLSLNELKWHFLRLQGLNPDELPDKAAVPELNSRLAQYLIADLTEELTITRGILFDMHRQSFHLQHKLQLYNQNPGQTTPNQTGPVVKAVG